MANPPRTTNQLRVVTLNSLTIPAGVESPETIADAASTRPKLMRRYTRIRKKLEKETAKTGTEVLIAVQDQDTSLLQSALAEASESGRTLQSGGIEAQFGEGLGGGDVMRWIFSALDHTDPLKRHPIKRPPDDAAGTFADAGRIAILGDWGTNLYGAPASAASILRNPGYELLMHLGDVYYSGTSAEVKKRFLQPWPAGAGKVSRALNGNHEMYSGGFAYFEEILCAFKQTSSYFAVQNRNWLLVGLDTAHDEHALDYEQTRWLKSVVRSAGDRKVILFSHHQPFSRLAGQGPLLQERLRGLLRKKAITAWYWGHEHDCIIYDRHEEWGLLGRCIGHGGIPSPRKTKVKKARAELQLNGISWRRLRQSTKAPSCLVLDGPNMLIPGEEEKFGPHGYLTLEFSGQTLIERIHLPDGSTIFEGKVT